jgi:hypothetical protein
MLTYSDDDDAGFGVTVFVKEVIAAGSQYRTDQRIKAYEERGEPPVELKLYFDEFDSMRECGDAVAKLVTIKRQARIGAVVASTSVPHMKLAAGEEVANTLLSSMPVIVDLTPDPDEVEKYAKQFGTYWRESRDHTYPDGPGEMPSTTVKEEETDIVKPARLADMPRGHGLFFGPASSGGRYQIVQMPHPTEPGTPVADARLYAEALKLPGLDWKAMRPSLFAEPARDDTTGAPSSPPGHAVPGDVATVRTVADDAAPALVDARDVATGPLDADDTLHPVADVQRPDAAPLTSRGDAAAEPAGRPTNTELSTPEASEPDDRLRRRPDRRGAPGV